MASLEDILASVVHEKKPFDINSHSTEIHERLSGSLAKPSLTLLNVLSPSLSLSHSV